MLILRADFHLLETVTRVRGVEFVDANCTRIVRLDGHHGHAAIFVVGCKLRDPLFIHLRDRTMIAGEDHHENGARAIVRKLVSLPSTPGSSKLGVRAEREDGMRVVSVGSN